MKLSLFACLAVLVMPLAAGAQQTPAPAEKPKAAQPKTPPAKNDPDRVICRGETVIGSNLPKRVCRTKAQMDREEAAALSFIQGAKATGVQIERKE